MTDERHPLRDLEAAIRAADRAAATSTVTIGRNGRGSGFVVATDRVLTCAHNLRDETVAVTFADARAEQARRHGADADGDLVVLEVPTGDVAPLAFADATPEVGTAVIALAHGGHRARHARLRQRRRPQLRRATRARRAAARSSAPRRWPAARRAAPSSTPPVACSA